MHRNDAATTCSQSCWPRILAGPLNCSDVVSGSISHSDWTAIINSAEMHNVTVALAIRLKQIGFWADIPEESRERLQQAQRKGIVAALKRQHTLSIVLDALATEGIVPIAYKGAALAFLSYPSPAMRSMGDLDFWLTEAEMPRGIEALKCIGFNQQMNNIERPLTLQATFEGEVQMHHPDFGLVELHWGVFPGEWLKHVTCIDRAAVKARVEMRSVFGRPMRVLSVEDHLLQVSLHASVSCKFTVNALRSLMDIALIADSITSWDAVVENAIQWRIARITGLTFYIVGTLFNHKSLLDAAKKLGQHLSYTPLLRYMDPQAVLDQRRLVDSKYQWAFLLQATDQKYDALGLLIHTLWPNRDWLNARYGRSGLSTRLSHLFDASRGRI